MLCKWQLISYGSIVSQQFVRIYSNHLQFFSTCSTQALLFSVSGDVEANPELGTKADKNKFDSIFFYSTRARGRVGSRTLLSKEKKSTWRTQACLRSHLSSVSRRWNFRNMASGSIGPAESGRPIKYVSDVSICIAKRFRTVVRKCRESKLYVKPFFYGTEDNQSETWAQSEKKVIGSCCSLLNEHFEAALI